MEKSIIDNSQGPGDEWNGRSLCNKPVGGFYDIE